MRNWCRISSRRTVGRASAACVCLGTVLRAQSQEPLSGFVPIDQVPRADQLPAAPLLIAAYAFIWMAVMVYVWSLWIRMNRVEADIRTLRKSAPGA